MVKLNLMNNCIAMKLDKFSIFEECGTKSMQKIKVEEKLYPRVYQSTHAIN